VVAHHGWSNDNDRTFKVTGEIQQVSYQNPHIIIDLKPNTRWLVPCAASHECSAVDWCDYL